MGFQKTVLIIALVVLSISIIVLSIFISKKDDEKTWPPESSTCPPYYDISKNVLGTLCNNSFDMGTKDTDISGVEISGHPNKCGNFYVKSNSGVIMNTTQKCDFVKKCKVNWEGWCEKPTYSY
tara:strand:+ start:723 stop:1091 length:369 start_codon:yes stop_codon:yes gene_type:complete